MRLLNSAISVLILSAAVSAQAESLDEARGIAAQIEQATKGRTHVLSEKASDDLYSGQGIAYLNGILNTILHAQGLDSKSPKEIGNIVVSAMAKASHMNDNGYVSLTQGNPEYEMLEAQTRFCKLASEPCNLFSRQISDEICRGSQQKANDLLM